MIYLKRSFLVLLIIFLTFFSKTNIVNSFQDPSQYSYSLAINGQGSINLDNITIFQGYSPSSGSEISFSNMIYNNSGIFGSILMSNGENSNETKIIKLSDLFFWNYSNSLEWTNFVKNYDSNHQNNPYHFIRYDELSSEVLILSQSDSLSQIIEVNTSTDLTISIEWFNSSILPSNYFLGQDINPSDVISLKLVMNNDLSPSPVYVPPSQLPIFFFGTIIIIFPILYFQKRTIKFIIKLIGVLFA